VQNAVSRRTRTDLHSPSRLHRGSATEYLCAVRAFAPMPLRRVREPFDDPACLYELKLDRFRALVFVDDGVCRLGSRNGQVFSAAA
jgi:ATP-dependent DNA ligase